MPTAGDLGFPEHSLTEGGLSLSCGVLTRRRQIVTCFLKQVQVASAQTSGTALSLGSSGSSCGEAELHLTSWSLVGPPENQSHTCSLPWRNLELRVSEHPAGLARGSGCSAPPEGGGRCVSIRLSPDHPSAQVPGSLFRFGRCAPALPWTVHGCV